MVERENHEHDRQDDKSDAPGQVNVPGDSPEGCFRCCLQFRVCLEQQISRFFPILRIKGQPFTFQQFKAVVTFKQKINDGMADYEAGDYVYIYNVTVK